MKEYLSFDYEIILSFQDLNSELENTIYRKLSTEEFLTKPFEVLNITEFNVKELLVKNNAILCKLKITALCNNPTINKTVVITENFKIDNDNLLLFFKGRIQILTKIKDKNKKEFHIKITDMKLLSRNILCIGEEIN